MFDDDDDLTPEQQEAWCADMRAQVADYLDREEVRHGRIGDYPAWLMAPYVSVWAVESLAAPGFVGWWVISGDLPTDYCASGPECDNPRRAMRVLAESWLSQVQATSEGAAEVGDTGLPADLADMLRARAEFLLQMVADAEIWDADTPDRDSPAKLH